ncbi:phage tail tube protein [Streptomyces sp. NPDC001985]|uniref:phage tail tube protein n=1 Tax=Streptomyces sp. NPDC001985 TaxID=3154406 RepID=UPI00333433A3
MSTPTETALARRWRLDINMGTDLAPDWALVPGVTEFQWTAEPNHEDATSYDTDGWKENTKTGQEWEVEATFNRKASPDSTTYAATHEKLRLASFAYGDASKVPVRFYDRNGLPEAYTGTALVTWEPQGGEYTALDQVQVTLTGTGPLTPITNPVTP